jgi:hypothetical protein
MSPQSRDLKECGGKEAIDRAEATDGGECGSRRDQRGATAWKCLKTPGISIDKDGNISLKGKQGNSLYRWPPIYFQDPI